MLNGVASVIPSAIAELLVDDPSSAIELSQEEHTVALPLDMSYDRLIDLVAQSEYIRLETVGDEPYGIQSNVSDPAQAGGLYAIQPDRSFAIQHDWSDPVQSDRAYAIRYALSVLPKNDGIIVTCSCNCIFTLAIRPGS